MNKRKFSNLYVGIPTTLIVALLALTFVFSVSGQEMEAVSGGTLCLRTAGITSLDPVFTAGDPTNMIVSQIFETLIRTVPNEDGSLTTIPGLAESWEFEEDGAVVIFHIRQRALYHDGNPVFAEGESREVVAEDVVYSFERAFNTVASPAVPSDLRNSYESIEAIDDYTVRLTLNGPNGLLFAPGRGISKMATFPPEAIEQLGDDFADHPIDTGPFEFVEYVPDDHVILQRNEDYYITPYLDEVLFKIIPDNNTSMIALEAGEIDHMRNIPPLDVSRLDESEDYVLYRHACPVAAQLIFSMNNPLFEDVRMREAIARAVDGNAISLAVNQSTHADSCGTAGPGVAGHDPDMCDKYFTQDLERSMSLLTELGYSDSDGDGIVDKDGESLVVPIDSWEIAPMPLLTEAVVTQLQDAGIGADLRVAEIGTVISYFNEGTGDSLLSMQGWCGEGGTTGLWGLGGFSEPIGVSYPEAQALLTESNKMVDFADRDAAVREAANLLYSQYPAIPLGLTYFFMGASSRVQDFSGQYWWMNIVIERNNTWVEQ